ncbi:hypothetical protein [Bdellovibrio svalbardensis]|uniref:Uncharacterized protein n=1 Tax=Bdellovibrio svalbardensis TaxID=2972972 RepID=A0ABT6DFS9_9BACT|nr:hypothetical protein [Bdellovibrio svalbardensis]MDG0814804.1 hypothetical protein [Bdellovibrio svalbardensis]
MKHLIVLLFILLGVQTIAMSAEAKTFTGFKRIPTSIVNELNGPVREFIETDSQFKILIGKHAAFYNFPKDQNAVELKQLLEESTKSKKTLKFKVDAVTRQIISIETGDSL